MNFALTVPFNQYDSLLPPIIAHSSNTSSKLQAEEAAQVYNYFHSAP